MKELLTKVEHELNFAIEDLRAANKKANPVEHIIIIQLLEKTGKLKNELDNFINAIAAQK